MAMLRYIDDLCLAVDATLIYCVRTRADVFFGRELAELQSRLRKFRYLQVLSQPDPEWSGPRGRLTQALIEREVETPSSSTFFLCGPPGFMDHTRQLLEVLHVDRSAILQESFGSATNAPETVASADPMRVEFVRTGRTCNLSPTETLLKVAELNAVSIPFGCRQGRCRTCATKLLSGNARMEREDGLSPDLKRRGFILPCVSRAISDLKLDA
jgi:ferredoxin-NADP reductase